MISRQLGLAQSLCFLSLVWSAWADGKIFTRAVAVPVTTPDQRAMLHFTNGVERLVIETSLVGPGTNFAWVIPLPSTPKIDVVSTNFFEYLNLAFQPKLIYRASSEWLVYAFFGFYVSGSLWICRKLGSKRLLTWLLILGSLLCVAVIALPHFVLARGVASVSAASPVAVLARQTVGIYDTATVSGRDGRALVEWLNTHGFYTPASALPVISSYVTQGWVFAAATLNRDVTAQTGSRPHPLAFTFRSEKPVYPLRLTGVENDRCSIELFVFGSARAEATGFQVQHCGKPLHPDQGPRPDLWIRKELFAPPDPGEYRIGNPELCDLALPAGVTTKLVATLTPKDMQSDAWIRWVPFKPALPILYSREAALSVSLAWFVGMGVIGVLIVQLLSPRLSRRACERGFVVVLIAATVCGLARLGTARITEVRIIRGGWIAARNNFKQLYVAIEMYASERNNPRPLTFAELQSDLRDYLRDSARNLFTDDVLRNEATPGNITLRNANNGVEVLWHDIHGAAHVLAIVPNKPK